MPINLTTPFNLPSGTRVLFASIRPDEESLQLTIVIELRTPAITDLVISRKIIKITDTISDKIKRGTSIPGSVLDDSLIVESGVSTPNAYTNAINAWKAGSTPNARKNALETHAITAPWYDSSLVGT